MLINKRGISEKGLSQITCQMSQSMQGKLGWEGSFDNFVRHCFITAGQAFKKLTGI